MPKRNRSKKNILKNISDASLKKIMQLKKKLLKGGVARDGKGNIIDPSTLDAGSTGSTGIPGKVPDTGFMSMNPVSVAKLDVGSTGIPGKVPDTGVQSDTGFMSIVPKTEPTAGLKVEEQKSGDTPVPVQEKSIFNFKSWFSGGKSKRNRRNKNRSNRNKKQTNKKRN